MKNDELEFSDIIKTIKNHWLMALIGFIIIFGSISIYTYTAQPVYQAKTLVLISNQDSTNFLLGTISPKISGLETQKIIILSDTVMYPVYQKYDINTFTVTLNTIKNSEIIEIIVESNNPEISSQIANSIADSYILATNKNREMSANSVIKFANEQISVINQELIVLDAKILDFTNKNNVTDLTISQKLEYQNMQRELTAKNKIYDYLLSKREEAGLMLSLDSANIQIVSYAQPPITPVRPNKALNLALGALLGICVGIGLAFLVDKRRDSKYRY